MPDPALPIDSTPIDPPILTGNYTGMVPSPGPTPADFWTRMDPNMGYINPSVTVSPADVYPAPGAGAAPSAPQQSVAGRIFGSTPAGAIINLLRGRPGDIPAVRLARSIGNMLPRQSWQQNAAANQGPVQGPPAIPAGGALIGFDPAGGGGGGTLRYDYGTGRTSPTPSQNPIYTTGGPWQPVGSGPADLRFARDSGTGNWQADATTKAHLLGGGYAGVPNKPGPDATNMFMPRAGIRNFADAEGGIGHEPVSAVMDPATAAALAAKKTLYEAAVRANPYRQGEGVGYVKRLNDWIAERNGTRLRQGYGGQGPAPITISGAPRIGGG